MTKKQQIKLAERVEKVIQNYINENVSDNEKEIIEEWLTLSIESGYDSEWEGWSIDITDSEIIKNFENYVENA